MCGDDSQSPSLAVVMESTVETCEAGDHAKQSCLLLSNVLVENGLFDNPK